ncbi:hypothetical protein [Nibricoccus sp. IMCC34717]|uniref:phage adaptor protein n=1 Tax=Nibricoccus sp. IMCC34717 TaxID=3034021 RepID=UPI00384CCF8C
MTKAEIADFACKKLGVTDQSTVTLAGDFAKKRWQMIWNSAAWRQSRHSAALTTTPGEPIVTLPPEFELVTAVRYGDDQMLLASDDVSAIAQDPAAFGATGPVLAYTPLGRDAAGNARIRLLRAPEAARPILVIGKRKCVDLTLSVDAPNIPGADECLCAFVLFDLAQWLRQYSAAEMYKQEANALLEQMRHIELSQATEVRRLIPYVQSSEVEF